MKKTIFKSEESDLLQNTFDLVKGDFTPEDAREILNYLISEKINFHERKSLSSQIRFGHTDENSMSRVNQLKHSRESANEIIGDARNQNRKVRITSSFTVEII